AMPAKSGTRASSRTIPAPRATQAALVTRAAVVCDTARIATLPLASGRLRQGYQADRPRNAKTRASGQASDAASPTQYDVGRASSAVRTAGSGIDAARYGSSLPFLARIGCMAG